MTFSFDKVNNSHNSVKFLGILVESSLGWTSHVEMISKRIVTGIFMLRILKLSVDTKTLINVYYAYIHSHLSYGTLIWGNHSSALHLFKLQKRHLELFVMKILLLTVDLYSFN